jgi:hypothetical protein
MPKQIGDTDSSFTHRQHDLNIRVRIVHKRKSIPSVREARAVSTDDVPVIGGVCIRQKPQTMCNNGRDNLLGMTGMTGMAV